MTRYYLKLIRWPNLLMTGLIMVLVRYFLIAVPLSHAALELPQSAFHFGLFTLVMVLLAAAGYAINDYFDMDIDGFNKPDRQIAGKFLPGNTVKKFSHTLNATAILLGIYLGYALQSLHLTLIFVMIAGMLWFYSSRYKRMLLIGNIIISLGAALSLVIVWFFELKGLMADPALLIEARRVMPTITGTVFAYALFAMISTFLRELVKDLEDVKGDARCGCRTFPVVYGIAMAKNLALAVLIVLITMILFWQYVLYYREMQAAFSVLFGSLGMALFALFRLFFSENPQHFRQVSTIIKVLMLAGLISIPFIHL